MIIQGDSIKVLETFEANSIDAIVTDPPYGLKFMSKRWDYSVPSVELWREALRVLKPGGHLLSFGGTRTYHRMVVNIEDAGFEIRDQIQWLYGSGFPKSTDVSKRIDKEAGAERDIVSVKNKTQSFGHAGNNCFGNDIDRGGIQQITTPSTDQAKQWQGFGSALKPANEPICLARKPLEKGLTLAANVLKWGCGGLNIDGCRVAPQDVSDDLFRSRQGGFSANSYIYQNDEKYNIQTVPPQGRWPANIILDETAAEMLDEQSGECKTGNIKPGTLQGFGKGANTYGKGVVERSFKTDTATGASRFFYVAKASKRERNAGLEGMPVRPMNTYNFSEDGSFTKNSTAQSGEQIRESRQNHHPTVKPIRLMEYLCKLITPPKGTVLDPFMGSGSTGVACKNLGFEFVGIEREQEYCEIAEKRIG